MSNKVTAIATTMGLAVLSVVAMPSVGAANTIDQLNVAFSTDASAALPASQPLNDVVELPDGKFMLATDGGLVRLNADGSKDITYPGNADPQAQTGWWRQARSVTVDSAGNAYFLSNWASAGAIGKLLPDGTEDPNFAHGASLNGNAQQIRILPSGDLLVAGSFSESNGSTDGLIKMTTAGVLDSAFNAKVGTYLKGSSFSAPDVFDLEIDAQGRIIMAIGSTNTAVGPLVRFDADGDPDTAFNQAVTAWLGDSSGSYWATGLDLEVLAGGGYLITVDFSGSDFPRVDILPDGHSWGGDCQSVGLFRIAADGSSDTAFNGTYGAGTCGPKTIVGGTFASGFGLSDVGQYTGQWGDPGDSGAITGDWVGYPRGVDVDSTGDILLGGTFYGPDFSSVVSGLIRLDSTGSWVADVAPGDSTWSGWNLSSGSTRNVFVVSLDPSGDTFLSGSSFNGARIRSFTGNPVAPSAPSLPPPPPPAPVVNPTPSTTPADTGPATTTPVTTTPPASAVAPGAAPSLVGASNQQALTRTPGSATALVNGEPVEVDLTSLADDPAAQTPPEQRTPGQIAALQQAATELVADLGPDAGITVVPTATGAQLAGVFVGTPVPVEDVIVVETPETATVFAALDPNGNPVEVQPGAVLEVSNDGEVGVVAFGLTPGEQVELVIMSTPTLIGTFTVADDGTVRTQTQLPDTIGGGEHTLVMASPSVQASLGLKVAAEQILPTPGVLPETGASTTDALPLVVLLVATGALLAVVTRRRNIAR